MKRIISFLLVFVSLFLLIGCKEEEKTPSIEITNKISTLKVDEEKKLTIKVLNAITTNPFYIFFSVKNFYC